MFAHIASGKVNATQEILREHSVQAVAWLSLVPISEIHSENQEQNAEQKEIREKYSLGCVFSAGLGANLEK